MLDIKAYQIPWTGQRCHEFSGTHCPAPEVQDTSLIARSGQHVVDWPTIKSRQTELQLVLDILYTLCHIQASAACLVSAIVNPAIAVHQTHDDFFLVRGEPVGPRGRVAVSQLLKTPPKTVFHSLRPLVVDKV